MEGRGGSTQKSFAKEQPEVSETAGTSSANADALSDGLSPGAQTNTSSNASNTNQTAASPSDGAAPRQPLPDLRQGIPPTFDIEFGKPAPSTTDGSSTETSKSPEPSAAQQKSLPDLRQGIPSSLEAESEAAEQASRGGVAADKDLDITEEHARPSSEGGRGGAGRDAGSGELPKSAYETSMERRRNQLANYMYAAILLGAVSGFVYFGRDWDNEEDARKHPDAPSGYAPTKIYQRARSRWDDYMGYYTEPTFPKLLPDIDPAPPYTLVISLEDLLIHSEWSREHGWRTAKRPGVDYFIRYLSQYYELCIFTSLPVASADQIIRKLDPFRIVMWNLFREGTRYEKGEYVKDLSYLNRDLSKVILVDSHAGHAKAQPENAIILDPWKGQANDKGLVALIPFLEYIATMSVEDVRKVLKSFEGKDIPTEFARRENLARKEFEKQMAAEKVKRPKISGLGSLSSALGIKGSMTQGGMALGEQSVAEGLAQGKMLSDQIRERGQKQYEMMEKEIRENSEKWLKEMAEEEKKMQEEQVKSMKSGFTSFFGGSADSGTEKK